MRFQPSFTPIARTFSHRLPYVALGGAGYFVVAVVSLHILRRDYDPFTRFLSEYAVGAYGSLMTSAFVALAVGSLALVAGLRLHNGPARVSRAGTILLLLWSMGVLLAGLFPTDLRGAPRTATGRVHDGAALIALISLPLGALFVSRRFKEHVGWQAHERRAVRLAWFALAALGAWGGFGAVGVVGLGQRIAVSASVGWLLVVAHHMRQVLVGTEK
jgi:hypothetical protein